MTARILQFVAFLLFYSASLICYAASTVECRLQIYRLTHPRTLVIPVFGDTHGNIEGLFRVVQSLQRQHGIQFPLVLQVGDSGFWPREADIEVSERNGYGPSLAAGVNRYLADDEVHRRYFVDPDNGRRLGFQLVGTWGNHDSIVGLRQRAAVNNLDLVPVDEHGVLHWLRDAGRLRLEISPEISFSISALGGVDPKTRPGLDPNLRIDPTALNELLNQAGEIDVLITHQGPSSAVKGSEDVDSLLELTQPRIHLHGHSHRSSENTIGTTQSIGLGRLPAERTPKPSPEFLGFLECHLDGSLNWSCDLNRAP